MDLGEMNVRIRGQFGADIRIPIIGEVLKQLLANSDEVAIRENIDELLFENLQEYLPRLNRLPGVNNWGLDVVSGSKYGVGLTISSTNNSLLGCRHS